MRALTKLVGGIAALGFVVAVPIGSAGERAAELPRISEEVRAMEFEDLDGKVLTPLECGKGTKASVVIFITVDCPIANAFQPTIRRLGERFEGEGVRMTLVHVDPDVDRARARKHAGEYGILLPVVLDPEHAMVSATGATITPEAVVVLPRGQVVYRGRINDLYTGLGERRRAPRTAELEEVIGAVLAGDAPDVESAPAVGCIIADFRRVPAGG